MMTIREARRAMGLRPWLTRFGWKTRVGFAVALLPVVVVVGAAHGLAEGLVWWAREVREQRLLDERANEFLAASGRQRVE